MPSSKHNIVASIARAKLELEDALEDLKALPMLDPMILGFITHALTNYLHISSGTVDLIGTELKGGANEKVQTWLDGLQEATRRMTRLVEELRSPMQSAPPQMKFEKIDFATLVGRACEFYRPVAARKRIELRMEKTTTRFPKVRTDRLAVAAVLDNLLSNAVKYSPPGKSVQVELCHRRESVTCRVRDEGPGLKASERATVFQRLRSLEANSSSPSRAGHGLAVAAELIAELGGEIGCESGKGAGTSFYFCLPCPRSTATAASEI